jgi:hypothetical protein
MLHQPAVDAAKTGLSFGFRQGLSVANAVGVEAAPFLGGQFEISEIMRSFGRPRHYSRSDDNKYNKDNCANVHTGNCRGSSARAVRRICKCRCSARHSKSRVSLELYAECGRE